MDIYFLCLANSYKHGNRCLAGVVMEQVTKTTFSVKKNSWQQAIWFRPINRVFEAGAIPNEEALNINIFDIVRATNVEACPDGAQQENYYYNELQVVGKENPTEELMDSIAKTNRKVIFGNKYLYVSHDYYQQLDSSVMMIKISHAECYLKERVESIPQPRMKFTFKGNTYDLPVTDPAFRDVIKNNINEANGNERYYLVLSLGVECGGNHYKLIGNVWCKKVAQ